MPGTLGEIANLELIEVGTWGVGILSDDLAKDVYDEFMELYDDGLTTLEIRNHLEKSHQDIDDEEKHIFILALAKAQWECQVLDKDVLDQVTEIVESGTGLELWKEESKLTLSKRIKTLQQFLLKLQTPKEKPRKRKKISKAEAPYEPGDCLTFKLADGNYGGALIVGKDNSHKAEGFNVVAITDLNSSTRPDVEQFLKAGVLQRRGIRGSMEHEIVNCLARLHKKHVKTLELVGRLNLTNKIIKSNSYCGWDYIIEIPNRFLFDCQNDIHIGEPKVTVSKLFIRNKGVIGIIKRFF